MPDHAFKKAWVRAKESKDPSFHYRGMIYDTASGERSTANSGVAGAVARRDASRSGRASYNDPTFDRDVGAPVKLKTSDGSIVGAGDDPPPGTPLGDQLKRYKERGERRK